MEAIVAQGLTKHFGDFVAVDGVSLKVAAGEVFGFLGPNGAGKTTTIRMLCGIITPSAGSAFVGGVDVTKQPEKVRGMIGYMSQRFSLYMDLTVSENLNLYAGIYGIPERDTPRLLQEVTEMCGLVGKEGLMVAELPTGWRQRLALGCAILHRPKVLFLDEPTSGVDPAARQRFWDLIYQLSSAGTAVMVSTHYMDEAEQCHRVGMIFHGRLVALDSPSRLKKVIPGKVYELATDDPQRGAEILRGVSGVAEISPYGRRIRVIIEEAGPTKGDIKGILKSAGIAIFSFAEVAPRLEDAFVYLAQRRGGLTGTPKGVKVFREGGE